MTHSYSSCTTSVAFTAFLLHTYITKSSFARKVEGIKDWPYTIELQDRGSPHVHMVLWTGQSAEQLMLIDDLVVAQIPNPRHDRHLYDLVIPRQIHKCSNYCRRDKEMCRFGFPKPVADLKEFDPITHRAIYKRTTIDSNVNAYCPYLLKLTEVWMDIQMNLGQLVVGYLAK